MILITVTAYALLVFLAILGFKKLDSVIKSIFIELSGIKTLLHNSSKREQNIKYNLSKVLRKSEKIIRRVK